MVFTGYPLYCLWRFVAPGLRRRRWHGFERSRACTGRFFGEGEAAAAPFQGTGKPGGDRLRPYWNGVVDRMRGGPYEDLGPVSDQMRAGTRTVTGGSFYRAPG